MKKNYFYLTLILLLICLITISCNTNQNLISNTNKIYYHKGRELKTRVSKLYLNNDNTIKYLTLIDDMGGAYFDTLIGTFKNEFFYYDVFPDIKCKSNYFQVEEQYDSSIVGRVYILSCIYYGIYPGTFSIIENLDTTKIENLIFHDLWEYNDTVKSKYMKTESFKICRKGVLKDSFEMFGEYFLSDQKNNLIKIKIIPQNPRYFYLDSLRIYKIPFNRLLIIENKKLKFYKLIK